jgi:hypothetical protein
LGLDLLGQTPPAANRGGCAGWTHQVYAGLLGQFILQAALFLGRQGLGRLEYLVKSEPGSFARQGGHAYLQHVLYQNCHGPSNGEANSMSHIQPDSEQALENATLDLFAQLGWQTADCFEETFGDGRDVPAECLYLGRETRSEVVLRPRLQAALVKLNPERPSRLPSKN